MAISKNKKTSTPEIKGIVGELQTIEGTISFFHADNVETINGPRFVANLGIVLNNDDGTPDYYRVTFWNDAAKKIAERDKKDSLVGSRVTINGRVRTRSNTVDGKTYINKDILIATREELPEGAKGFKITKVHVDVDFGDDE